MLKDLNKSAATALIARALAAASGVTLTILLPMCFPLEQVGTFYLVLTQAVLFSIFARFGLDYSVNSAMVQASVSEQESGQAALSYWIGVVLISIACSLVWLLAGNHVAKWLRLEEASKHIGSIAMLGSAYAMSNYLSQLYKLNGRVFMASMSRSFLPNAVVIGLLLIFMATEIKDISFGSLLQVLTLCTLMAAVINCTLYLHIYFQRKNFSLQLINQAIKGSPRFFFYSLLIFIITDVDYLFLGYFAEKSDIAVYATMKRLALISAILIDIANLIFPKLFKQAIQHPEQMTKIVRLSRRASFLATIISAIAIIFTYFFGEYFIKALLGQEYIQGIEILLILMLSFAVALACGFSEAFLILKNEQALLLKSMVISFIFVLASNFFLVPLFGGVGAACTFLMANVLMRISFSFYVWKKYGIKFYAGW